MPAEEQEAINPVPEAGEYVVFIDDGQAMHDALVLRVYIHQDGMSETGAPTIDLVYVDVQTECSVMIGSVPHESKVTADAGKRWRQPWEVMPSDGDDE